VSAAKRLLGTGRNARAASVSELELLDAGRAGNGDNAGQTDKPGQRHLRRFGRWWGDWGGVDLGDPEPAEFVFQAVAPTPAAGEPGGEDIPLNVGRGAGRNAMGGTSIAEFSQDDGAGNAAVRGDRERVAAWSSSQFKISTAKRM
jgi:hypothetical protein